MYRIAVQPSLFRGFNILLNGEEVACAMNYADADVVAAQIEGQQMGSLDAMALELNAAPARSYEH
jgi:hypothetical protein